MANIAWVRSVITVAQEGLSTEEKLLANKALDDLYEDIEKIEDTRGYHMLCVLYANKAGINLDINTKFPNSMASSFSGSSRLPNKEIKLEEDAAWEDQTEGWEDLLALYDPNLIRYYVEYEAGCGLYNKYDPEGYFPEEYMVDGCLADNCIMESFETEDSLIEFINEKTGKSCVNIKEAYTAAAELTDEYCDTYLNVYSCRNYA